MHPLTDLRARLVPFAGGSLSKDREIAPVPLLIGPFFGGYGNKAEIRPTRFTFTGTCRFLHRNAHAGALGASR